MKQRVNCSHDDSRMRFRIQPGRLEPSVYCLDCKNERQQTQRDTQVRVFTGVDGEGVTLEDGEHRYVLLTIGSCTEHPECEAIHNDGEQLQWWEVFKYLHRYGTHKAHAHEILVGFFLQYDFTNWLKTLPEERASMLLTTKGQASRRPSRGSRLRNPVPFPVRYRDPTGHEWEFDMLSKRRFKIRPTGGQWVYVCDVGPFWQTSFLKAIDPKTWPVPVCTPEEYEIVRQGKEERATAQFGPEMMRYNATENIILGRVMAELDKAFQKSGIKLTRTKWFGPGQVAEAWLSAQSIPQFEELYALIPSDVWTAAMSTYYGGWFEIFAHGHIGTGYEYDINSAYPHTIGLLPCLRHGTWTHGMDSCAPPGYSIIHAEVHGSNPVVGTMLHRTREGNILRPGRTRGHYWLKELESAIRARTVDTFEILEWWHYEPCGCPPPLSEIYTLYNRRLEVGKNTPEGKALKLTYNSAYGKTAQTVGQPKWANPIYASLITSTCRTQILEAIATHPRGTAAVLMVATDGVYFDSPHPTLDIDSKRIGAWDESTLPGMTLFQPGLYWSDKSRRQYSNDEEVTIKSRGVSGKYLAPHMARLDDEFAVFADRIAAGTPHDEWPALRIPIPFSMVSAELAIARGKWDTAGVVDTKGERLVSSNPRMKRAGAQPTHDQYVRTTPRSTSSVWGFEESHPYDKLMALSQRTEELVSPDGPLNYELAEYLQ